MSRPDVFELLVTPQEAVMLSDFRTSRDIFICLDIAEECGLSENSPDIVLSSWKTMSLLSTIWNAGRIQGIRSERLRHRE